MLADNNLKSFLKEGFEEITKNSEHYPSVATPHNEHFKFYRKPINEKYDMILMYNPNTLDAIFRINFYKHFKEVRKVDDPENNVKGIHGYGYVIKQVRFKIV